LNLVERLDLSANIRHSPPLTVLVAVNVAVKFLSGADAGV